MGNPPPPVIALLWHNRLFAAPEFYRRFFKDRRLAALVSASGDGGWLAGFGASGHSTGARVSSQSRGLCSQGVSDGIEGWL